MSPERYRAELAALAVDTCEACDAWGPEGIEIPLTDLLRCAHCEGLFCSYHSIRDLDSCKSAECLTKAANALRLQLIHMREMRAAALVVLDEAHKARLHICAQRKVRAAISILRGD